MKKFTAFILALSIVLPLCGYAKAVPAAPETTAASVILTDYDGNVLYEKNSDKRLAPASVTKIMTMLLVFEAIDNGTLSMDDTVTASAYASSMGGSQIYLKEGEQMSVRDMLKSVAVSSANDAAVALGEHLAGSEESFVSIMNKRAKELGMNDTTFMNCCGLPAEGHLTTAADIAKMSAELLKHENVTNFTTIWMDTVRNGQFSLANTNKMLRTFDGMTGLKTGFTSEAKYCLSASAKRGDTGFIAVLMGCPTSAERFSDAAKLLNYAFASYASVPVTTDEAIPTVPVKLGKLPYIHGVITPASPALVEKDRIANVEKKIEMLAEISAPVEKGAEIGSLTLTLDGKEIAKASVVAAQDVPRISFGDILGNILRIAFMRSYK